MQESTSIFLNSKNNWFLDLFLVSAFLIIFYYIGIGSYPLFTPDEGRYSEVAREMIATGDFITPRLNGVVFFDKPILYYWLQASAIKLFGLKEWSLRFWPAMIGILGSLITYLTGRLLFNRRTALLSAFILATFPLYYGGAHYANLDLEVAIFIASSLLFFITGVKTGRTLFFLIAYASAGLAALTKGLIGIVFPIMIIGSWILLLNRWRVLKHMHLLLGIIIFAAITVPWYVMVQMANPSFFDFFFLKQQVSRFLTHDYFNNQTVVWFYLPIVIVGTAPWCVFLLQTFYYHLKQIWLDRKKQYVELFILLSVILIFCFFSIPKSKTLGYILPIFPLLALLIGHYLNSALDNPKSIGFSTGIIIYIVGCLLNPLIYFFIPTLISDTPQFIPYLKYFSILFFCSGFLSLFFLYKKRKAAQLITLITSAFIFLLILIASCSAINQKTVKPLVNQIKTILQPNDEVITYFKYYQDLPIYLERRITIVTNWQDADIPFNDNWIRELWYGMPYQNTAEWLINEDTFWQRWNSNKRVFVFTDTDFFPNFKCRSKGPIHQIAKYNDLILLSNAQ